MPALLQLSILQVMRSKHIGQISMTKVQKEGWKKYAGKDFRKNVFQATVKK